MSAIVTHYLAPTGHFIHALPAAFGACNASRQVAKVDCEFCLSILGTNATHAPTERTETLTEAEREMLDDSLVDSGCHGFQGDHPDLYAAVERILASRLAVRDGGVARESAQVVAGEYEGYLHSDSLDPAWIAGWHSAINHATHALTHRPAPDASGDAGEGGGS